MSTMSTMSNVKLVFREKGKKQLEELVAPAEVVKELIAKHAPICISPDLGKSWKVAFAGDWDYCYIVGTHIPEQKKVAVEVKKALAASAPVVSAPITSKPVNTPAEEVPWPTIDRRKYTEKAKLPLKCSISGLFLGEFIASQGLALATPYVTAWKQTVFVHPIFSMKLGELLHRAQACWELEKSGTKQFPMLHKQLLFLAMLHASGCIRQETPGLPAPRIVETHFSRLIEMLSWKHETASDRVHFPKLHIWKGAAKESEYSLFSGVEVWLTACEVCKEEYESVSRERMAKVKAKAKELALKNIRSAMYKDISLKRLWNWVTSQVPSSVVENNPDLEQLFFTEESQIHLWTKEDIEALESLVLKYCELGNSVSYEVSRRIRQLENWRAIYFDTFEIVVDSEKFAEHRGQQEPRIEDFPTKAAFLVARARWSLANKAAPAPEKTSSKKITGDDL